MSDGWPRIALEWETLTMFMRTQWYRLTQQLPRTPCVFGLTDASRDKMIYIGQAKFLDEAIAELMADTSHKVHEHEPVLVCAETNAMDDVRQRRYEVLLAEFNPPANS
jgi:hypothetical protein